MTQLMQLDSGVAFGLDRRPRVASDTLGGGLQAFDRADVYLLNTVDVAEQPTLIVNDRFGALAVGLAARGEAREVPEATDATNAKDAKDAPGAIDVTGAAKSLGWWSDSQRAARAAVSNLSDNGLEPATLSFVTGDADLSTAVGIAEPITRVVMRLPKSLVWLEDQLLRLRAVLAPGAVVVAGGMIKHTPRRAYELLERCIGPTTTSLGWKKARLATAIFDPDRVLAPCLEPTSVDVPALGARLLSRPNVFSWGRLDQGSRLLLDNLGASSQPLNALDIGCGNGVLTLALARAYPTSAVVGVDESYQAVASARVNADALLAANDRGRVDFVVADMLAGVIEPGSMDLVVCNPPFHEAHVVAERTAGAMFVDARQALKRGGRLLVVGNRHLEHQQRLTRLFGSCSVVAATSKFVVVSARR